MSSPSRSYLTPEQRLAVYDVLCKRGDDNSLAHTAHSMRHDEDASVPVLLAAEAYCLHRKKWLAWAQTIRSPSPAEEAEYQDQVHVLDRDLAQIRDRIKQMLGADQPAPCIAKSGVTIVEVLIVAAIILIIVAMFIPVVSSGLKAKQGPPAVPVSGTTAQFIPVDFSEDGLYLFVLPTGERLACAKNWRGVGLCLLPPLPEPSLEKPDAPAP